MTARLSISFFIPTVNQLVAPTLNLSTKSDFKAPRVNTWNWRRKVSFLFPNYTFFYISTSFISTPSLRYWENLSTLLSTLQAEISDLKKKILSNFYNMPIFRHFLLEFDKNQRKLWLKLKLFIISICKYTQDFDLILIEMTEFIMIFKNIIA